MIVWGERIAREGDGALHALLDVAAALDLAGNDGSGLLEVPELTNARGLREAGCLPDAGPGLTDQMREGKRPPARAPRRSAPPSSPARSSPCSSSASTPSATSPTPRPGSRALAAADHVVAFSMFENATTAKADVVFPLETHAEKDGTVTHPDGRLQRVRPSASRPGDIRPNWGVLAELSAALGHDTGITSQPTAFAAIDRAQSPSTPASTTPSIGGRGIRWQDRPAARRNRPAARESAGAGLAGHSARNRHRGTETACGSSRVRRVRPDGSLALGTYRDLWAGPITELNPPLRFLAPQQRVEMSPADAERLGLKNGDEVKVAQNGSSVRAHVAIKERMREGVCFLIEGTAEGNANALLNGGPVSVEITKVGE